MDNLDIEKILAYAKQNKVSDIHLSEGLPITFRIDGTLIKLNDQPHLTHENILHVRDHMLGQTPLRTEELHKKWEIDFAYVDKEGASYRVNAFHKLGKLAFVMRRIEREARKMEELGLPEGTKKFIGARQWLVLVTGPTGAGKSSTLVSILNEINQSRREHIITIEDPIEFIFTDEKSIFSQREVGKDTQSFVAAIRAAMREDPDIVMVGEMRDKETVEAALNLAETGHLVFSTLHTSGSVQTISRVMQFFHPDIQHQIQTRLADSLLGVLSQRLLRRRDEQKGRVGIFELMLINSGIKNLIRTGDVGQINNAIQMGRNEGMLPMFVSAQNLEQQGIIHREDYEGFFVNQDI